MPRIIAGERRGARLRAPLGAATRPTADRVKESLFNIINERLGGAKVLDLFAGTGSLGLEALSRGADSATFVDSATATLIGENAKRLRVAGRTKILRADAFAALRRLTASEAGFDVIFADPPYHRGLSQELLALIDDNAALLAPKGLLVVEHGADETMPTDLRHLALTRAKTYGKTTQISFYGRLLQP